MWAGLKLPHRVVYGLAHGALLFMVVGGVLGAAAGRAPRGAVSGAAIGLAAAGSYYLLSPLVGYWAMLFVWAFVWMALAILAGRALRTAQASWAETLTRGTLAMIGAALGFYAISGIWRPFDPEGWDYIVHFVSWTIAYLPPFAALLVRRGRGRV